ncbi:hypothetical protein K1719_013413 [Acacia pycnantha]|nr:hypothetical protein K1719_013413 [Acacia pycnantha]
MVTSAAPAPAPAEVTLPAESGGSGDYFVKVGLGTLARELSLIFDTGSDLTWTQCLPCLRSDSCYTQNEPIFDPPKSSSYSNIPCSSSQCYQLFFATGNLGLEGAYRYLLIYIYIYIKEILRRVPHHREIACMYNISYGDRSFSAGNYAKETLTIRYLYVNSIMSCIHLYRRNPIYGCG